MPENRIPSHVPGGFFVYHALGDEEICYADPNVIELFGCDSMEDFRAYTGNSFRGMVHPEDLEKTENKILVQTFESGRKHDYVRYRIITKQGAVRFVEDYGHLMHSPDGKSYYYVFIVDMDRTDFENQDDSSFAEMQLFRDNKRVDRLTGFLNMNAFYEKAQEMTRDGADVYHEPCSVVVFDVLGLREVNRNLGRAEGDARICALAEIIRAKMPKGTQVYRGHEAELIAVYRHRDDVPLLPIVMEIVNACKSDVLFGIGATNDLHSSYTEGGTLLQALEEALLDLKIKKMLNAGSEQSQALKSLVRALEEVDADTEEHVQRTQKMGLALGRRIGLSDFQLTLLQLLCLLHDIGKITVPLEILNKPGKLTDEEWAVLRSHSEKGYQIAIATEELKPLADGILYHHERWDGRGYPAGLKEQEIPILSRIISIVDAYDAMVNDRSYRKAMLPEKAKKEIRDNAGTQFDPHLAQEFLNLLEEHPSLSFGVHTGGGDVRTFEDHGRQESGHGSTLPVAYARYMLDIDDIIIEVDDAFEQMTGYTRREVIGKKSQYDLIPASERDYYMNHVRNQFARGNVAYLKHPLQRRDGSVIQVICHGERHFDSSVRKFRSTILISEL